MAACRLVLLLPLRLVIIVVLLLGVPLVIL